MSYGFWRRVGDVVAKNLVTEKAFEAGQRGDSPPQYSNSDAGQYLQELSDQAYERGQKALLVKLGNRLTDRD
jgi:hypothetical protein